MIALVDCNNFYVSCEQVFRPDLCGKPVVVLSNNDEKGCIVARSEEAKKLGITMGNPFFKWEKFFQENKVTYFSSNYALYGDMSARVMKTIREFVEEMDVYSIDEAFLDLSAYQNLDLRIFGRKIARTILQNTGIPVSIGIARTRTLAKIASKFAKKYKGYEGVCLITNEQQRIQALKLFNVGDIWGIGRQYTNFLNRNGIFTAYDFICRPQSWIRKYLTVNGARTWQELQGTPCVGLEQAAAKKSICTSRSFGFLITDYTILSETVSEFAASCARKLREQNTAAAAVSVFIHTNPFREQSIQFYADQTARLEVATDNTGEIIKTALLLLKQMYKPGYELKKAGVIVSAIVPAGQIQGNLFDHKDRRQFRKADAVMDKINNRYGRNTLKTAAQVAPAKTSWKLHSKYLSPAYTTNWNELIRIK